jgi:hypothetical protein
MVNLKILVAMGIMTMLAATVARITFSRTKIFSSSPKFLTKAEITLLPSPTVTPTSQPEDKTSGLLLADFRYPQAEVVSLEANNLSLKSFDSVEAITGWYKKKITDLNLSIRSFIQTNTNGAVSSRLTGVGKKGKIGVEIEKEEASASVKILVTVSGLND